MCNLENIKLLTKREYEVFKLIFEEGLTDKQIAEKLVVSIPTVRTHAANIHQKLNLNGITRAQMIVQYWKAKTGIFT